MNIQRIVAYLFIAAGAITIAAFWTAVGYSLTGYEDIPCTYGENVGIVSMYGVIDLYDDPEYGVISVDPIVGAIDDLSANDDIETIVLEIYSPGGLASAGELVMNALMRSPKNTVALIKEDGASAAYLAATGADTIYATRLSQAGSIGVTASYLDSSEKNAKEGVRFVELSSGKFKDMYNPDKPMTEEEKAKFMEAVNKTHAIFVDMVAENRGIPREDVQKMADGTSFLADEALERKLIDKIGDLDTVLTDLSDGDEYPAVCYYTTTMTVPAE